eukprot:CAMPEP_0117540436 /NCGR_PEP_ID=MMETSP0784-20121206/43501_1 /TAXON_ID=39447 /ORGANISM="" /LENGTH=61 /DNA_ID=CAMNT_0005337097 /DNA_START=160 /DNA_END=345 /DNA_ORIENTATION=-
MKNWPLVSGASGAFARQNLQPRPNRGMVWAVSSNVLFSNSLEQNSAKKRTFSLSSEGHRLR